jgi:type IV pilus assembly protein PilY1
VDNLATFYRQRSTKGSQEHRPLGDISGSEAVYVKAPLWNYVDPQYAEFKAAQKDRRAMVYVGANDGMLHAFHADADAQARPPSKVATRPGPTFRAGLSPTLYQLADKNYPGKHRFFVDGTPVIGDICATANCQNSSAVWKTILVGGLGRGGQGYYALDVTDPATPKALWEFSNDNLGYTYGNPVITKLKNGTWVVIVASGYNNTDGDGKGTPVHPQRQYRRAAENHRHHCAGDAIRRAVWRRSPPGPTSRTSTTPPSASMAAICWAICGASTSTATSFRMATTRICWRRSRMRTGKAQAITARPELGKVKNHPVVFVGTGKLLGASDFEPISETEPKFQRQSFYAIKDRLDATDYGNPRSTEVTKDGTAIKAFTAWTIGTGECPQGASFCKAAQGNNKADPTATICESRETPRAVCVARLAQTRQQAISNAMGPYNDGWYVDLPGDGEQSNTDPSLQRGSIVFTTNRPLEGGGCEPKASSFRYFIDYRTGSAIEGTNGIIGVKIADSLATRAAVVVLTTDKLFGLTRIDKPAIEPAEIPTPPAGEAARRVSWRELVVE